jgi:hypothetical protein
MLFLARKKQILLQLVWLQNTNAGAIIAYTKSKTSEDGPLQ